MAEGAHDAPAEGKAKANTNCSRHDNHRAFAQNGFAGCGNAYDLKRGHREKRANRIVHNAFPFQELAGTPTKLGLAQQWHDHGRACHHQNARKHYGAAPVEPGGITGSQCAKPPCHRPAEEHHAPNGGASIA